LASGGGDYTVKVWDILRGECLETLEGHNSWVWKVAFSPDGTTLASGSSDETVKIWDTQEIGLVRKDRCLKTLKAEGPYKGMNIRGAKGLTDAEKAALKALGAVED
jgi:WD40 repeat protein